MSSVHSVWVATCSRCHGNVHEDEAVLPRDPHRLDDVYCAACFGDATRAMCKDEGESVCPACDGTGIIRNGDERWSWHWCALCEAKGWV